METEEQEKPSITFDHSSNGYPRSVERLQAEIYLVKDANTTKQVIEIPSEHIDASTARLLASKAKLKLIHVDDNFYLYDPKLNTAELKKAIQAGEHGEEMGYGCKSCPDEGVDYAVDTEGNGTTDPEEILEMRNTNKLGFAGRAENEDTAKGKIEEMGRCLCRGKSCG